jgi:hypothetical protein
MGRWLILLPDFLINLSAGYFLAGIGIQIVSQSYFFEKVITSFLNLTYAIIFYILAVISYQINNERFN